MKTIQLSYEFEKLRSRSRSVGALLATLFSISFLTACATAQVAAAPADAPIARRPSYSGPKKTIAVTRFDAHGAFLARYGGADIGGGLAAQLATALSRSDQFVLVERAELPAVLEEQELGLRGLTQASTAPRAGQLIGAQFLIRGSVTEFNEADNGGGFSIGAPLSSGFSGAVSPRFATGHVAIDFRVIDTSSGRVVATHTSRAEINRRSLALAGLSSDVSFSGDAFQRSALGEATRSAIGDAVQYTSAALAGIPWSAHVAKVKAGQVYLTAGANANLSRGAALAVYQVADRVVDPTTGEVLGVEEVEVGSVLLEHVEPRYARGSFIGVATPRAGDIVRFQPGHVALGFRAER